MTAAKAGLRRGGSAAADPWQAVAELQAQLRQPDPALILIFCAADYEREALARAILHHFGDAPVYGCTTAGEITPFGYISGGLSGISFPASEFQVEGALFRGLSVFNITDTIRRTRAAAAALQISELNLLPGGVESSHCFGLLLIDGLSVREEQLVSAVGNTLAGIPLLGGSAGTASISKNASCCMGACFSPTPPSCC